MKYEHTNNEYVRLPRTLRGAGECTNKEENYRRWNKKIEIWNMETKTIDNEIRK